jgi:hypothetical protein
MSPRRGRPPVDPETERPMDELDAAFMTQQEEPDAFDADAFIQALLNDQPVEITLIDERESAAE